MNTLLLSCAFLVFSNTQFETLAVFEAPNNETYLTFPYSMDFANNGDLYVLDQSQVHVWKKDGSFKFSFGKEGNGPGELIQAKKLTIVEQQIYIWGGNGRISIFDLNGLFIRSIKIPAIEPKALGILNKDLLLLGYRSFSNDGQCSAIFESRDGQGKLIEQLQVTPNNFFLKPLKDNNHTTIQGYPPEVDIQKGPNGSWYFGFGQNNLIYQIDQNGKILGKKPYEVTASMATEDDKAYFLNRTITTATGQSLQIKDLPNLKITFNEAKAHYTNFTIVNDKIIFALTAIGSTDSAGNGAARASYQICDLHSGKKLSQGAYNLAEDSVVLYRNGRIVAFIPDAQGDYSIQEMTLKGLHSTPANYAPLK